MSITTPSSSSNSSRTGSGTFFPADFIFENETSGPQLTSLYDPTSVQLPPTYSMFFGQQPPPIPGQVYQGPLPSGGEVSTTGSPGATPPPLQNLAAPSQNMLTYRDLTSGYAAGPYVSKTADLQRFYRDAGLDPNQAYSAADLQNAWQSLGWPSGTSRTAFDQAFKHGGSLAALRAKNESQQAGGTVAGSPTTAVGSGGQQLIPAPGVVGLPQNQQQLVQAVQGNIMRGPDLSGLQNVPYVSAPSLGAGPSISTPTIRAGQVNAGASANIQAPQAPRSVIDHEFTPEYLTALYRARTEPVEYDVNRREALNLQQTDAALAAAGIASSGAGLDLRQRVRNEYSNILAQGQREAAHQSTVQMFGEEMNVKIIQAQLDNTLNLTNAGFTLAARTDSARFAVETAIMNAQLDTQARITTGQLALQGAVAGANIRSARDIAQMNAALTSQQSNQGAYLQAMGLSINGQMAAVQEQIRLLDLMGRDVNNLNENQLRSAAIQVDQRSSLLATLGNIGRSSFSQSQGQSSGGSTFALI